MTITDFLLARIAEDEERLDVNLPTFIDGRRVPHRQWRECEAKRRIVEYAGLIAGDPTLPSTHLARHVLADLAAVYADHPDYDDAWRP